MRFLVFELDPWDWARFLNLLLVETPTDDRSRRRWALLWHDRL